jgi:hypothetical protein
MGSNLAHDLAENVIDIRQSISIQLRSNHYPPVPLTMVEPCIEAIYAVSDGDTHKSIQLPDGVQWRGYPTAPAYAIVEGHHLEPWCTYDYE